MSDAPIVSTGRGGRGNIGPDSHTYTDGGIVREGVQGESADGTFSTGRGGAGNLAQSPRVGPQSDGRRSEDYIPETALREHQENFHTGRGGEGNVHKDKYGGHSHSPERKSIGDKVKSLLKHDKKPEHPSPLQNQTTT
ncbi:hypothetical protein K504DRAFT_458139 [Pleomassaria siparia CBS 279.74]|uniref:Uncharacterized protein n=1 Tax=Pleomassaria siparia CBS 279.74 TaxID=1314801 RepID=A0A6G1K4H0_9PLEO|nr:hypothetical protein K504DRAFT_458139 [Pleomassaria siparia CBS 279.74]